MNDIWESEGRKSAKEDYEKYEKGEYTKEQLARGCQFSAWCASFGDEEAQAKGYGYLQQMKELGIIKSLKRID